MDSQREDKAFSEAAFSPRLLDSDPELGNLLPFLSDRDRADRLAGWESWRTSSSRALEPHLEPYTLPWFLQIDRRRYARHGAWLPRTLEFNKHRGEKLLAIGDGLGTDWVRYAENGTDVTVCSGSPEHRLIVRRHFDLRAVRGEFCEANPTALPAINFGMDLVCLSEREWKVGELPAMVAEIFRVLKPGGKVIAMFPAIRNSQHWQRLLMPWKRWFGAPPARSSSVGFQSRELHAAFAAFADIRVFKRHLRRAELPYLWRVLPLPLLERVMGRFLILKAFKPLSAIAAMPVAA